MESVDMKMGKETENKPDEKREVNSLLSSMCAVSFVPLVLLSSSNLTLGFKGLIVIAFLISNFSIAKKYKKQTDNGNLVRQMLLVNFIFVIILNLADLPLGSRLFIIAVGALNLWNTHVYDKEMKANK